MTRKTISVFGASGFIGTNLTTTLAGKGFRTLALQHRPVQAISSIANIERHAGHLETPEEFLPFIEQSDTIVHTASCSTPALTAKSPLLELEKNLRPTLALLTALQTHPECRLIYLSSGGTLYGDTLSEYPTPETAGIKPKSYYGAGKAAAEHFIHAAAAQYGLDCIILRPSNIYGPGQHVRKGFGIIPTAFEHSLKHTEMTLWGDGQATRDYLYISDFCDLVLSILATETTSGCTTFNVGSGRSVSLNTLLETIQSVTDIPLRLKSSEQRASDVTHLALDISLAASRYGWSPKVTLCDGLKQTWDWYRAQHD